MLKTVRIAPISIVFSKSHNLQFDRFRQLHELGLNISEASEEDCGPKLVHMTDAMKSRSGIEQVQIHFQIDFSIINFVWLLMNLS